MKKLILLLISTILLVIVYLSFSSLGFSSSDAISDQLLETAKPFSGKIDVSYLEQTFKINQSSESAQ